MESNISVYSHAELFARIAAHEPLGANCIFISDPHCHPSASFPPQEVSDYFDAVLPLLFFDAATAQQQPKGFAPLLANEAHIDAVIAFYNAHRESVVVSCYAGISRSPAVALGLLRMSTGSDAEARSRLRAIRPEASPLKHIAALFDAALESKLAPICEEIREAHLSKVRALVDEIATLWEPL